MTQNISFDPIPNATTLTQENTFLRIRKGPGTDQEIALNRMTLMVGRNDPPNVTVDLDLTPYELGEPPMTSRLHAVLEWVDGELRLCDLNSRNGTMINGEKLSANTPNSPSSFISLKVGDAIAFANIEMEVIIRE